MSTKSQFEKIIEKMKFLSSDEFKIELLKEIGKEGLEIIDKEFSDEKDPYSKAWAQLKKSRPGGGILNKTGKLKDSFGFDIEPAKIIFKNTADYAEYHQNGTDVMPQRAMLPYNAAPELWLERFKEIVDRKMRELFNV